MADEQIVTLDAPFTGGSWSDTPPTEVLQEAVNNTEETGAAATTEIVVDDGKKKVEEVSTSISTASNEEVIDPNEYLKKKWGWENEELADKEINELRELKNKKTDDIVFANDQSKQIHELLREGKPESRKAVKEFLETQEKLENLVSADVSDDTAEDIIKLSLKLKHKDLSDKEIEHKFNKQYSIPREPVELASETAEEFEQRHNEWESKVAEIKMERIIDAKLAKPELAKFNSELVLPNIQKEEKPETEVQSQEELDRIDKIRKNFLEKLESDYKNFNGYEFKYKDEEVEIPANYVVPDEQKIALKAELENFDVDGFIGSRWFNQDGTPNVTQMMDDIVLLRDKEKVFQKVANEIGSKMKEHYIKVKSNINVGGQQSVFQPNGEKSEMDKQIEHIWKNG
jgi:hypothetical protein